MYSNDYLAMQMYKVRETENQQRSSYKRALQEIIAEYRAQKHGPRQTRR